MGGNAVLLGPLGPNDRENDSTQGKGVPIGIMEDHSGSSVGNGGEGQDGENGCLEGRGSGNREEGLELGHPGE